MKVPGLIVTIYYILLLDKAHSQRLDHRSHLHAHNIYTAGKMACIKGHFVTAL